jgi:hypothetical protein
MCKKNSFVIERTRKDTSNVVDVDLNSGCVFWLGEEEEESSELFKSS